MFFPSAKQSLRQIERGNGMEVEKKQNAHIKQYLGIINPFWKIRAVEILSGHDIVCNVQFLFNVN